MKDSEYKEGLLKGKRVLIIEDNSVSAALMRESLNSMGILSDVAVDGLAGIEQIESTPSGYYDCILMDIQMPNINGYEATGRIRQMDDDMKSNIPIIAVTSHTFEDDIRKTYEAGMNGFQAKPIMPKLIYQELCRQILH